MIYNKLPSLKRLDIDWTVIEKGQKFDHSFHQKAFVCKNYSTLYRIYLTSPDIPDLKKLVDYIYVDSYGANGQTFSKKPHVGEWMTIFSTNNSSLVSPFSEFIPCSCNTAAFGRTARCQRIFRMRILKNMRNFSKNPLHSLQIYLARFHNA